MNCIKCKSDRILDIYGKVSDCYSHVFKGKDYQGYVPDGLGIGGGDDIEFKYCLNCGQIQGTFPVEDPSFEDDDGTCDYVCDKCENFVNNICTIAGI